MIKEYFITNNLLAITQLRIDEKYITIQLKSSVKVPKYYYTSLLTYLYNIVPYSINIKMYNNYYKLITLKYLIIC